MKKFKVKSVLITPSTDDGYKVTFEIGQVDNNGIADVNLLKADLEVLNDQKNKLSMQHKATFIYCSYEKVDNYNVYFINPLLRSIESINWFDDIPVSGGISSFKSNKFDSPAKVDVKFTYIDGDENKEFEINNVSLMQFKN